MERNTDGKRVVLELDGALAHGLGYTVSASDLLEDIKYLCKEYYIMTFSGSDGSLLLSLNNGQKFRLHLTEVV